MNIKVLLITSLFPFLVGASEKVSSDAPVYISAGILGYDLHINDKQTIRLERNQSRKNNIDPKYSATYRGKIHPMNPFGEFKVETIGEIEVIDYIRKINGGDDSILIVDTRKKSWFEVNGHIPLSINIPARNFKYDKSTKEILDDVMGVMVENDIFDYTYARTLVMYCNGSWCGKTPSAINKLLSYGYPSHKIKYYRGGMQAWKSLGLTVVNVFNKGDEIIK